MSGSLWCPGIKEHIFSHEPKRRPDCMCFSLGDRGAKTRNLVLRAVRRNTAESDFLLALQMGLLAHTMDAFLPQRIVGQRLLEQLEVDGHFQPDLAVRALRDAFKEQGGDFLYNSALSIRRLTFHAMQVVVSF